MPVEIERKFLVSSDAWRHGATGRRYRQGYLKQSGNPPTIRIRTVGTDAFLTIKSQPTGIVRDEYEYRIPLDDAEAMLENLCLHPLIEKIRYEIWHQGSLWEVDEFLSRNTGLVVAEIELQSPDQVFSRPPWLGREVTGDSRYSNSSLASCPFADWQYAEILRSSPV